MIEKGITYSNQMMEKTSYISPVKYAAAYSTQRDRIFNLFMGVCPM